MNKSIKKRGFTLLELLLVVGIAAVLIIAGITTYNLVNRGNQINETIRLVNTIIDSARRTNGNDFSGIDEGAIVASASIPAKYVNGGEIVTPFDDAATAVALANSGGNNFSIALDIPESFQLEVAQAFNPATSSDIVSILYCGLTTPATTVSPANCTDPGTDATGAATITLVVK